MGDLAEPRDVFQAAEEVRVLDDDGGGLVRDGGLQGGDVRHPAGGRDEIDAQVHVLDIGVHDFTVDRMDRVGHDQTLAARQFTGHDCGFGQGRGAVVHGGVGDVHAEQVAEQGLELEDALQDALADLGLIRRVGRVELGAPCDRADGRRHVVVIDTRAEETGVRVGIDVAVGQFGKVTAQGDLVHARRDVQFPHEAQCLGDGREQVVQ